MKPQTLIIILINLVIISSGPLRKLQGSPKHILLGIDGYKYDEYDEVNNFITFFIYVLHILPPDFIPKVFTFNYTISNSSKEYKNNKIDIISSFPDSDNNGNNGTSFEGSDGSIDDEAGIEKINRFLSDKENNTLIKYNITLVIPKDQVYNPNTFKIDPDSIKIGNDPIIVSPSVRKVLENITTADGTNTIKVVKDADEPFDTFYIMKNTVIEPYSKHNELTFRADGRIDGFDDNSSKIQLYTLNNEKYNCTAENREDNHFYLITKAKNIDTSIDNLNNAIAVYPDGRFLLMELADDYIETYPTNNIYYKTKSGVSAGTIVAIVIPTIIVLICITLVVIMLTKKQIIPKSENTNAHIGLDSTAEINQN